MHLDAHIHIVGNGRGGSGCWLRVSGFWHRPLAAYMMRHIGLPGLALDAPARLRGFISGADYRRCRAIPNVIERDYQLKAAMGFAPEHFTRVGQLLRTAAPS